MALLSDKGAWKVCLGECVRSTWVVVVPAVESGLGLLNNALLEGQAFE